MNATVHAVARDKSHRFSKSPAMFIRLIAGHGVEGDAHAGPTVKHRSRVARDPSAPNLRQVHLLHHELLTELDIPPGALGENITTSGIDLLSLPEGTKLTLGPTATIAITGLRNPCSQIESYRPGLLRAVLTRTPDGTTLRKSGIMAIVLTDGDIHPGDPITITLPPGTPRPLAVV